MDYSKLQDRYCLAKDKLKELEKKASKLQQDISTSKCCSDVEKQNLEDKIKKIESKIRKIREFTKKCEQKFESKIFDVMEEDMSREIAMMIVRDFSFKLNESSSKISITVSSSDPSLAVDESEYVQYGESLKDTDPGYPY